MLHLPVSTRRTLTYRKMTLSLVWISRAVAPNVARYHDTLDKSPPYITQ